MAGRTQMTGIAAALAAAATAAAPAAAGIGGGLPQGGEPFPLDPAQFTTRIDNPWWPMRPGTRWRYRATTPGGERQRVVVTVTHRTRRIADGITARVVRDTASERGRVVEDTRDWYAQDATGNVWYLGEATRAFPRGGPVDTAGSFEAGVDGAQAGVVVPADPVPGLRYRQEWYPGHAEDQAAIVSVDEQAGTPAGHFAPVLMTRETNPLEPRALEFKFLARGIGPVLAIGVSGDPEREELVRLRRPR